MHVRQKVVEIVLSIFVGYDYGDPMPRPTFGGPPAATPGPNVITVGAEEFTCGCIEVGRISVDLDLGIYFRWHAATELFALRSVRTQHGSEFVFDLDPFFVEPVCFGKVGLLIQS